MKYPPSELIINPDGSIYHLNLLPDDVADTIIFVGDPDRVPMVSEYFDRVEVHKQKREFCAHTGIMNDHRLTVISTGIGTDNIDIVINELDALKNINFEARTDKAKFTPLKFIRIGTSGAIREDVPVDSIIASAYAVGLDGLGQFYEKIDQAPAMIQPLSNYFDEKVGQKMGIHGCYSASASIELLSHFENKFSFKKGITITAAGFYGPQGRSIKLSNKMSTLFEKAHAFNWKNLTCTNLEMETSGIYLLANLLGHQALSFNAILANRVTNEFSLQPKKTVDSLIKNVLNAL